MTEAINELELTPALGRFVELAARGYDPADAAELAGYDRGEARALIRHPRVNAALVAEARQLARGRLFPLALRALTRLLEDPTTPPVTVARVALGILSYAGAFDPNAQSPNRPVGDSGELADLPIGDMSREQLNEAKAKINHSLTFDGVAREAPRLTAQGVERQPG